MELNSATDFGEVADAAQRAVRLRVGLGAGIVLVVAAAAVAVGVSAVSAHPASSLSAHSTSSVSTASASTAAVSTPSASDQAKLGSGDGSTALVQVVGQVNKPGLYELSTTDRIVDAIAAAGGFTTKADQSSLNLAQVVADGQQIVVGVKGAAPPPAISGSGATAKVNLNTADVTALETLDGIGPALAARILAYRTAHGGFRSINDLQNVTGIGPKKFAAIKAGVSL